MKLRTDFVTNSSSSNFVCISCGTEQACGRNDCMSDLDWVSCENYHEICPHCKEDLEVIDGEVPETSCPGCQLDDTLIGNVLNYIYKTRGLSYAELMKEIKERFKSDESLFKKFLKEK